MDKFLWVGLGGAAGAMLRYGISLLPFKGEFPLLTLLTNLAGAFLIGVITGAAERNGGMKEQWMLLLKTGVCGGFTTFSTFSLEALTLMEHGKNASAAAYIVLSAAGCIAGVWLGRSLFRID